ncbi:hypothetical protein EDC65_3604 [Stella humosa]|uniref:PhiE125 gp8 family phage protein n=1 Tax=Stella humosa TaxID=94 RepID=A0A3N1L4B9_9PROT|nr:hypothetical protein [Stella humosa]ROP84255.1 hypothetical protein EDC65_3604 [Stella humosa]BBK33768.1 hypothetical protein STHU_44020 [Stella humosa]
MLTVTTAAEDYNLLTPAELRQAVGLSGDDASKDATLAPLGLRVAAAIAQVCFVAPAGASPPTLRMETVTETVPTGMRDGLLLSRRPVVAITSVVEDGAALDPGDYEVDPTTAILSRVYGGRCAYWSAGRIVVVYQAGWAAVPHDVKQAAAMWVQWLYHQAGRDPMLRSEEVPDVYSASWATPTSRDAPMPAGVPELLAAYRNAWIA